MPNEILAKQLLVLMPQYGVNDFKKVVIETIDKLVDQSKSEHLNRPLTPKQMRDYQDFADVLRGYTDDFQLNLITIQDWAGNKLFEGHYLDPQVDAVLEANECKAKGCGGGRVCKSCNDTGYAGDFEVFWVDEMRDDNVYEFINY